MGIERYETAVQNARELRVVNEWSREAMKELNSYKPVEYPLPKAARRHYVDLFAMGGPLVPGTAQQPDPLPFPPEVLDPPIAEARAAIERHDLAAAERVLAAAISTEPSNAEASGLLVAIHLRQSGTDEVLHLTHRWFSGHPENREAARLRAYALFVTGQLNHAAESAERWRAAHRDDTPMRLLWAEIRIASGRWDDAIEDCHELLRQGKSDTAVLRTLARAFAAKGLDELALHTVRLGLANGADAALFFIRFDVYVKRKDRARAEEALREAVEAEPDFAEALNNLGVVYQETGDYAAAKTVLERAVKIAPGSRSALLNLGAAYQGRGEVAKARDAYDRALRLGGPFPDASFNLGVLLSDCQVEGLTDEARLELAVRAFQTYKAAAGSRIDRDDLADDYIAEARRRLEEARLPRKAPGRPRAQE